jgi:beta-glucosidase
MLSADEQAARLLRQLTLDEKIQLLHQYAPAVPRLGLAGFRTGTEVLHGVAWLGTATVFPQAVGLAASWNPLLLGEVGRAVGAEVRALHLRDETVSLNVWGPVVNLLRDPRWGRNEEGYSEDPFLSAVLAIEYCRGLRGGGCGDTPTRLTTAPTLKHFLAYNHETDKPGTSADVRPRVFWEYDVRPFEWAIKASVVSGVMLSYNKVNGRPCHATPLIELLRSWQPDLLVVSDAHGTKGMVEDLRYFDDLPHAYAAALRAGLDSFTNDSADPTSTVDTLRSAVALGLLAESDLDPAVHRLLRLRARLGEFTVDEAGAAVGSGKIDTPGHRALALRAARQSLVLLKNDGGLLPLTRERRGRVAVVGPHADKVLLDWISGAPPYQRSVLAVLRERLGEDGVVFVEGVDRIALRLDGTEEYLTAAPGEDGAPVRIAVGAAGVSQLFDVFDWGDGIVALRAVANGKFLSRGDDGLLRNSALIPHGWTVPEALRLIALADGTYRVLQVSSGCCVSVYDGLVHADTTDAAAGAAFRLKRVCSAVDQVTECVASADTVLVVAGTHPLINGREGQDQRDLALPAAQEAVARSAVEGNARTAVVIVSGEPTAVPWLAQHAAALLWSSHGGQEQGTAIVDVLLGVCSPAGRLPQTWYRSAEDAGDILEYDIIGGAKTYMYYAGELLYPFGHGLSYTVFRYGPVSLDKASATAEDVLCVQVDITNAGPMDGDEVVQLYVRTPGAWIVRPRRELRGVSRLHLTVGETATATFQVAVADLTFWDVGRGQYVVEPGNYEVLVGRSSADIVATGRFLVVAGPRVPREVGNALLRAVDFDDCSGIRIVDEARAGGDAVMALRPGAWLCFRHVQLGCVDRLAAQVAAVGDAPAAIEMRLGDPAAGELVGRLEVPVVWDDWRWRTVESDARGGGRHDLYVIFSAPARLASFGFTRASGVG